MAGKAGTEVTGKSLRWLKDRVTTSLTLPAPHLPLLEQHKAEQTKPKGGFGHFLLSPLKSLSSRSCSQIPWSVSTQTCQDPPWCCHGHNLPFLLSPDPDCPLPGQVMLLRPFPFTADSPNLFLQLTAPSNTSSFSRFLKKNSFMTILTQSAT